MKYRITIDTLSPDQDKWGNYEEEEVYKQILEGDDSIITAVSATVLDYRSLKSHPPVIVGSRPFTKLDKGEK